MPVASMTWASAGIVTDEAAPTAVIFPPCITMTVVDCAVRDREDLPPLRARAFPGRRMERERQESATIIAENP